ncbi:MAG: hypothetical protein K8R25_02125 [Methanosarcinales archaeon]|nr:hypothetical protein [Methanosarcinales archaeon]
MLKIWIVLLVILAITSLGCMDSDKTEGTIKTGDVDIEYSVSEDSEDEWCPVGSSFKMSDPSTGGMASWEVVGTEVIDGIEMCKWVMESTEEDGESFKMEMYHSQDESITITKTYDSSDNIVNEMTMSEDGTMITINYDSSGNVVEKITTSEKGMIIEDGDGKITGDYTQ